MPVGVLSMTRSKLDLSGSQISTAKYAKLSVSRYFIKYHQSCYKNTCHFTARRAVCVNHYCYGVHFLCLSVTVIQK